MDSIATAHGDPSRSGHFEFPAGVGLRLTKGTRLLLNLHLYNANGMLGVRCERNDVDARNMHSCCKPVGQCNLSGCTASNAKLWYIWWSSRRTNYRRRYTWKRSSHYRVHATKLNRRQCYI